MKQSEEEKGLISRICNDDSEAFTLFFDLYYSRVYKFTGYFLRTADVRQELTSDVFITLWNNRKALPEVENLESYIYTLTKNKALNYIDKLQRQPEIVSEIPLEIRFENRTPEEMLLDKELETVLNSSVNELPERCKLIFMLAREEGLKYREIAQILSISEKTVNAQMVIALKRIGQAIKKYLFLFL